MLKIIGLVISLFFLGSSAAFHCGKAPTSKKSKHGGKQTQKLGEIKSGKLVKKTTIAGFVQPERTLELKATYSAYIRKIFVKTGTRIKKGQPLVSISESITTPMENVFPIRAPFSGTVTFVHRKEGEFIDKTGSDDKTILRLDDFSQLYIQGEIPEIDVSSVKKGLETSITLNAIPFTKFKGRVNSVALSAKTNQQRWDNRSATYPVVIDILDPSAEIKPGMSAVAEIKTLEKEDVLLIMHRYVGKDSKGYFARSEGGEKKYLELGDFNETYYEIVKGLKSGEKVSQIDFTKDFMAN